MGCWSMILVQAGRISHLKKYSRTDLTLEVTPWAGPLVCYSRHFRQSEIRPLTKSKSASYEHTHTRWVTNDADNFCFQLHCCVTWESSTEAKAVYINIIQFLASKKAAQKRSEQTLLLFSGIVLIRSDQKSSPRAHHKLPCKKFLARAGCLINPHSWASGQGNLSRAVAQPTAPQAEITAYNLTLTY